MCIPLNINIGAKEHKAKATEAAWSQDCLGEVGGEVGVPERVGPCPWRG